MARIRTIKPEFWQDEKMSAAPIVDRLVFLGLIGMADDCGRLLDNVKVIDAWIFSATDDTCAESLDRLAISGRIRRGVTESSQKVIQIVNWERHQKIDKPNLKSALPKIKQVTELPVASPTPPRHVGDEASNHTNDRHTNDRHTVIPTTISRRGATTRAPGGDAPVPWLAAYFEPYTAKVGAIKPARLAKAVAEPRAASPDEALTSFLAWLEHPRRKFLTTPEKWATCWRDFLPQTFTGEIYDPITGDPTPEFARFAGLVKP